MARATDRAPLSGRTLVACMSLDRVTRSGLPLEQSTFGKSMPTEATLGTEDSSLYENYCSIRWEEEILHTNNIL